MKTDIVSIQVNHNIKVEAEHILNHLGLSLSEAIHYMLAQVIVEKALPFEINLVPNIKTKKSPKNTNLQELENQLIEAKKKIEEINHTKTEFMMNIAHDIKTPFTGIWGIAHYLWDTEQDPTRKKSLEDITQCAQELLGYCDRILEFSRIRSDTWTIMTQEFNLITLIESIIKMESPAAAYKQLELRKRMDHQLPSRVVGDDYRLQRILVNLISNAIKFTETGRVVLEVSLLEKTGKEILIQCIVEDTGIGIAKEQQAYIFEKYTCLSLSNTEQGLGLGLQVVKRFIDELGGKIDLLSTLGKGSQFICTIPLKLPSGAHSKG